MHRHLGFLGSALLLSMWCAGCSPEKAASSPDWPWGSSSIQDLKGCQGVCTYSEMYQSVIAATSFCRQVSNFYEGTGNINSRVKLGVKTLGVVAGSVLGVISGGTAAKAWSSLSGATNGIQTDLGDEALVRSNRARIISGLLEKFHSEISGILSGSTVSETDKAKVVLASLSVSGQCATFSQALPPDEVVLLEKKVTAINKLVSDQLKKPEILAADHAYVASADASKEEAIVKNTETINAHGR